MSEDDAYLQTTRLHHEPVMVGEIIELFSSMPVGTIVDVTLGNGGHSEAMLVRFPMHRVLGIDRDHSALGRAIGRLNGFHGRIKVRHARFSDVKQVVRDEVSSGFIGAKDGVSAILADLGVSSAQLNEMSRGFAFAGEAQLDMRMDQSDEQMATAYEVVNGYSTERLAAIFASNGERRLARRYANSIVRHRPIDRPSQLAQIIQEATPAALRRGRVNPATRVFQAIRIEVNQEEQELDSLLQDGFDVLADGGVFAVISYHSGEDRKVKRFFKEVVSGGCHCPPKLGCVCGAVPMASHLTKGALSPSITEVAFNPRSRSAKLRAVRRTLNLASQSADQ